MYTPVTYQQAFSEYKKATINTSSPGELVLMLYNGLIKFLRHAKLALHEKKINDAHNYIIRAEDIIEALLSALDYEKGGDIAKNLSMIYDYTYWRLVEANTKKDESIIDEVIEILNPLREAWKEIVKT